ncbi:MAG: phosphoribosyltransferase [Luteitalea sp.]|nr:phosphoribosyltransferase [Luteitalea sp.]
MLHARDRSPISFERVCQKEGKRVDVVDPYAPGREPFANRREAGALLAKRLGHYKNRTDVVVLALLRGGVPVGFEVARELGAPLDVFFVRKLGLPGHGELAMGAIASGGVRVLNEDVVAWYKIPATVIERVAREEQRELEGRQRAYRGERPPADLRGRVVLLVDDGLATGSTMKAAVQAAQAHAPSRTVVAVPVGARDTCRELGDLADEVVCAHTPETFAAVGQSYRDFAQIGDSEIRELLRESAETAARAR